MFLFKTRIFSIVSDSKSSQRIFSGRIPFSILEYCKEMFEMNLFLHQEEKLAERELFSPCSASAGTKL